MCVITILPQIKPINLYFVPHQAQIIYNTNSSGSDELGAATDEESQPSRSNNHITSEIYFFCRTKRA